MERVKVHCRIKPNIVQSPEVDEDKNGQEIMKENTVTNNVDGITVLDAKVTCQAKEYTFDTILQHETQEQIYTKVAFTVVQVRYIGKLERLKL